MNEKIGIVGKGFIGEALHEHMKDYFHALVWDIDPVKRNVSSLEELVLQTEVAFISVPTPMDKRTGQCDVSILRTVVRQIQGIVNTHKKTGYTIVIRSTIPPGTSRSFLMDLSGKFSTNIVFNPEFLTEANYIQDFKNQNRIVLGGYNNNGMDIVKAIYSHAFPNVPIVELSLEEAEMVKYFTNTFLATKVTFANQMHDICDALDIDYNKVISTVTLDKRIPNTHLKVPGPDGYMGFGGTCFPKDLSACIYFAKQAGVNVEFLEAINNVNLKTREVHDWKLLKGRAISN